MEATVKTIRLYGVLGSKFGRVHRFAVHSPAEAVRALCCMIPGIERFFTGAKEQGLTFAVFSGKKNLSEEELRYPSGQDEIRIAPIIIGAKAGVFQTIIGAVLVVVGAVFFHMPFLVNLGIAMIAGGISQMLAPHPKSKSGDKPNNTPNYSFNGIVNTEAQGNPVPVYYGGPSKVGSAVISAGIEANDGVYVPTQQAATGSGNSFGSIIAYAVAGSGGSGGAGGGNLAL